MGLLNLTHLSSLSHCTSWIPWFIPPLSTTYIYFNIYCAFLFVFVLHFFSWDTTVVGESAAFQFSRLSDYDTNVLVRGAVCETPGHAPSTGNSLAQMLEKPFFTWILQNLCLNITRTYVSTPGLRLLRTIIPWKCLILTKQSITLFLTISVYP